MLQADGKEVFDEEADALLPNSNHSFRQNLPSEKAFLSTWHFIVTASSLLLNITLLLVLFSRVLEHGQTQATSYAGLTFSKPVTMTHDGPYGSSNPNETERAILWESLDTSKAQIAVDKTWASEQGLPPTQQFTWDESKAVYSLRGFHAQHCLRKLYRWVAISHHNGTQLDEYGHVVHCLDSLLQDVHCWADETPMMAPPKGSGVHIWGGGQQRQCRDWSKLERWAEKHNSCFIYINETQGVKSMFDRYKWCPPDSPYQLAMRTRLNISGDWDSRAPREIDTIPPYWHAFSNSD